MARKWGWATKKNGRGGEQGNAAKPIPQLRHRSLIKARAGKAALERNLSASPANAKEGEGKGRQLALRTRQTFHQVAGELISTADVCARRGSALCQPWLSTQPRQFSMNEVQGCLITA